MNPDRLFFTTMNWLTWWKRSSNKQADAQRSPSTSQLGVESLEAREVLSNTPVLYLPGIFGSFTEQSRVGDFLVNRGISPELLIDDPITHVYRDVAKTFQRAGYTEGVDLIAANYDWRLPLAMTDSNVDGYLENVTADSLTDGDFDTALDYLAYWMNKARAMTGSDEVNVVAHSMGGLVARAYVQSAAYGQGGLPTIKSLVTIGTPHAGASLAWNPLNNDWDTSLTYRVAMSKVLDSAWDLVNEGWTITGPDQWITKSSLYAGGVSESEAQVRFIGQYAPSLRSLMPTYDFIDFQGDGLGYTNVNSDPGWQNTLLLDLNFDVDRMVHNVITTGSSTGNDVVIISGSGEDTNMYVEEYSGFGGWVLPFTDYVSNLTWSGTYYTDESGGKAGDGTVPLLSSYGTFQDVSNVQNVIYAGDHSGLMSNHDVQARILDTFDVGLSSSQISTDSQRLLGGALWLFTANRTPTSSVWSSGYQYEMPRIEKMTINDGSSQHLNVNSLTVVFNTRVNVAAHAFEVRRFDGTLMSVSVRLDEVAGRTIARVTFPGGASLADGNYTLTIVASRITTHHGTWLDGNDNRIPGGNYRADFSSPYDVDSSFYVFANVAYLDVDHDGDVDDNDYLHFVVW